MTTAYVPHRFGDSATEKLRSGVHWLTGGVASSIAWPRCDVWVRYGGADYILRGTEQEGKPAPPGISIPCERANVDEGLASLYRFTSILGWFKRGFVDISSHHWATHPIRVGDPRNVFTTHRSGGTRSFSCNHMPLIEDEQTRKALAFWREGKRLSGAHESFAFLSFYKVVESQFADGKAESKRKVAWINANLDLLTGGAARRVAELRRSGLDVGVHLFESGRCAVAHAKLGGDIVDPDIPADRRRIQDDLAVMQGLAERLIRDHLGVKDEDDVHATRNRLAPWFPLIGVASVDKLKSSDASVVLRSLNGRPVSVGLWPDGPIAGLENMTTRVDEIRGYAVKVTLINRNATVFLVFVLDFEKGRVLTQLKEGDLRLDDPNVTEADVRAYGEYFYRVLANAKAELIVAGTEPIDCDIVIPVNIVPPDPDAAILEVIEKFRRAHR